jgi:hypothetical protein
MSKVSSPKGRLAVLFAALATACAVVAYTAATASADGRTINGAFCNDTPSKHFFCLEATFGDQQAEGFCGGGTLLTCTPGQNSGGVISLRPGTYWISVIDNSSVHDFTLRSCPGSSSACDESSGGAETPITDDPFVSPNPVVVKVHLDHGTARLFCDNDSHEGKGMYVDFVIGGVGQVG